MEEAEIKLSAASKMEHTHVDTELDAFPYLATHSGKSREALYPRQNAGILQYVKYRGTWRDVAARLAGRQRDRQKDKQRQKGRQRDV